MSNESLPQALQEIIDAVKSWNLTYPIVSIETAFEQAAQGKPGLPYRGQFLSLQFVSGHFSAEELPIQSDNELITAIANEEIVQRGGLDPDELRHDLTDSGPGNRPRLIGAPRTAIRLTVRDRLTNGTVAECSFNCDYFDEGNGVFTVIAEPDQWLYCSAGGYTSAWCNVMDFGSAYLFLIPARPQLPKNPPGVGPRE